MPVIVNSNLQEDLSYVHKINSLKKSQDTLTPLSDNRRKDVFHQDQDISGKMKHAQVLQELLIVLAICNTVVVSKHPHHDVVSTGRRLVVFPPTFYFP